MVEAAATARVRGMVESTRLLEGQAALVTGAGRGLGRAFAERLAALGCPIGVHGMREQGPAEYGEGTTLTDTAHAIGEAHGVRTCRVLGDLWSGVRITCLRQVLLAVLILMLFSTQVASLRLQCLSNSAEASEQEACDGGSQCWLVVLMCGKGRLAPQERCVDVEWKPCGVCFGWSTD